MADALDAYKVLQIDPSALPEVVEAAYRALARIRDPDRNDLSYASEAMADLNWAYSILRDPERRIHYDQTRGAAVAVSAAEGSLRERMEAARGGESQGINPEGKIVLDFGRYSGMSLVEVARVDPEYLEWLKRRPLAARYRQQIEELTARLRARYADPGNGVD
ncbi:MAG: DnaJ domain-containing protein [Candidatus Limnocylindria bacterium]